MGNILTKIKDLFKARDLTKGNIAKSIILITIPLLISHLIQNLYSITDASIIGHNLSAQEFAGVNDVTCLVYILLDFALGCCAGFSAITASAIGEKDDEKARKSFGTIIVLGVIIGIFTTVLFIIFADPMLSLLNLKPGNKVYDYGKQYIVTYAIGCIAMIAFNAIQNILIAKGDSVTPLLFLILSSVLNILLDLLFICVFKAGVVGAAVATIISQGISAVLCFIYAFKKYPELKLKQRHFFLEPKFAFLHIKNGVPLGLEFTILVFGIIAIQGRVVNFDLLLANPDLPAQVGYGASSKLGSLLYCVFQSLGAAMLTFIGQNYGAKNYQRIRQGLIESLRIMFFASIVVGVVGFLLINDGFYLRFFLDPKTITEDTKKYAALPLLVNLPFVSLLGMIYIFRNTCQGVQKPLYPFLSGICELGARLFFAYIISEVIMANQTSDFAFASLTFAETFSWFLGDIPIIIGALIFLHKNKKGSN